MSAGAEYKTLNDALAIIKIENALVCMDCGVLVVDKKAHDQLHSIMSSWALGLAILKTSHASEEIHDKWDVIQRIDRRRFRNNNADDTKNEGE